jgi:Zn-dependent M28 family amino/carboxypeptidase
LAGGREVDSVSDFFGNIVMPKLTSGIYRPFKSLVLGAAAAVSLSACNPIQQDIESQSLSTPLVEQSRLEADVRFLASDLLEGREAGTRGYDISASFVAERFRALGLKPAPGQENYYQQVPLQNIKPTLKFGGHMTLSGPDAPKTFEGGVDYVGRASGAGTEIDIEAPVVFVGYGLVSEKYQRDDYAGLDVDGKIVAYIIGAPKFLDSEERAYYSNQRSRVASERGAIGTISLYSEGFERRLSFAKVVKGTEHRSESHWTDAEGRAHNDSPNIQAGAILGLDGASKLFGDRWEGIAAAAESESGEMESFELNLSARIKVNAKHSESRSANVVGYLEGSDPLLKHEYVVISGHMDHEGIQETDEEGDDEIYNGAMDNATGVSSVLELARIMSKNPPRRSMLFIALTAEEKGLLGSDYFANNPLVPIEDIAANVNLDMPVLTYEFTDVVVYGAERSTLFPVVQEAARRAGVSLSPDPVPEQGIFTRSDHYSFVQQGVPAVYLDTGFANGGEEAVLDFLQNHYHEVSDETEKVVFRQLRRFTEVNLLIAEGVANMDSRPVWKRGDFFGKVFNGPMEK